MKSTVLVVVLLLLLGSVAFLLLSDPEPARPVGMEASAGAAALSGAPAAAAADVRGTTEGSTSRSEIEGAGLAGVSPTTRLSFAGAAAIVTARLVDGRGKPATGAEARVLRASAHGVEWMEDPPESESELEWPAIAADANGRVRVEVPAGTGLRVDFGGTYWRTQARDLQPLREGEVADLGELALTTATRLSGRVTGEAGAPLAGAKVQLRAADVGEFWEGHQLLHSAETDAEGWVSFPGVPRGRVRVEANAARHAAGTIEALEVSGVGADLAFALQLERGAALSGRVVDSDRRPIVGAKIYLIHQKESEYYWGDYLPPVPDREPDGVSAADGSFQVEGLPRLAPGAKSRSMLIAHAEEIGTGSAKEVRAGENATITIPRGVRASGIVVTGDGEPLAGATVMLQQNTPWGWTDQKSTVTSGSDGRFSTTLVPPGAYELLVSASIGGSEPLPLELQRDVEDLRLRVERDPLLSILVLDPDGLPVPHARVDAHTPGVSSGGQTFSIGLSEMVMEHPGPSGWSSTAESDENGRAVFREPPAAEIQLGISAQGWARHHVRMRSSGGDQEESCTMERPGSLLVLVRDGAGQSVRGVSIRLRDPEHDFDAPAQSTDHLGRAVWRDLAPGRWEIRHDAGGDESSYHFDDFVMLGSEGGKEEKASEATGVAVKVEAGRQTEHEILLEDLALLTVRVLRGGTPAPDVSVRLQRMQDEGDFNMGWNSGEAEGVRTDARGIAVLLPVSAGDYELIAKTGRNTPETRLSLSLHTGPQEQDLPLNGAEVRGILRELQGPLAGARVTLTPFEPEGEKKPERHAMIAMSGMDGSFSLEFGDAGDASTASSDQYGAYLFQDVPEGQWVVSAKHKGVGPWTSLPFTVSGDRAVRVGEHTMLPGAALHGHDHNWKGPKPESEAWNFDWNSSIRVETAAGRMVGMTQPDASGDWRIEDLEEGDYIVSRGGWRSPPIHLSPGEIQRQDVPKEEPKATPGG